MTLVIHAHDRESALAGARERAGEVTVVWPDAPLAEVVELMQAEARIAGVIDGRPAPAIADAGVEYAVRDAAEATACMRGLATYLAARGVRDSLATAVEQAADELVTNALFNAPVDAAGAQLYAGMSPRRRMRYRTDQRVGVRCRADGGNVALVVSDCFGSLRRASVLRTLYKCIHTERPVDNRTEGAGVGMYLALSAASELRCEVRPNHSTEITAIFEDGVPRTQFVFIVHPTVQGPREARLVRIVDPRVHRAAALALPLLAVAGALLAPPLAVPVAITSEPRGALVVVDGRPLGTTPLRRAVEPHVTVELALPGYHPARVTLFYQTSLHQTLRADPRSARLRLTSDPPGAAVVVAGQQPWRERRFTPTTIVVEPGVPVAFTLVMPGYVPVSLAPLSVNAGATVERHIIMPRTRDAGALK